jgi:hypothetical protein
MGLIGYLLATRHIFLIIGALWVPLIFALARIRASDIHFARSCGAHNHRAGDPQRVSRGALFKDRGLLIFALCLFLFQLANASLLSQIGQTLVHAEGRLSSLVVSALVVFCRRVSAMGGTGRRYLGTSALLIIGLAAGTDALRAFCVDSGRCFSSFSCWTA